MWLQNCSLFDTKEDVLLAAVLVSVCSSANNPAVILRLERTVNRNLILLRLYRDKYNRIVLVTGAIKANSQYVHPVFQLKLEHVFVIFYSWLCGCLIESNILRNLRDLGSGIPGLPQQLQKITITKSTVINKNLSSEKIPKQQKPQFWGFGWK